MSCVRSAEADEGAQRERVYFLEVVCDESSCFGVVQLDTARQAALGELAKLRDDKLVEFSGTELHCGYGWQ
jgi:hypothetical protein